MNNTEPSVQPLNLRWRHLWISALLSSFAITMFVFVIPSAKFMAISNPWRSLESQLIATDPRYHNHEVLEHLNKQPRVRVLSFAPAWIFPHTDARVVSYMDKEILHLFDNTTVISAEELRLELQRLGIAYIHKDNYFSYPMIYRSSFRELLADSKYVIPVVMGPGGNLFELRTKDDKSVAITRCNSYTSPYLVTTVLESPAKRIIGFVTQTVGISSTKKPVFTTREFRYDKQLQTKFLPIESSNSFYNSAPQTSNPSMNGFLRIEAEIRGFGIAKGEIQFPETTAVLYNYAIQPPWIVFSESRDKAGVVYLSGLVPIKDASVFRIRISTRPERLPASFEIVSLTTCLQN